MATGDLTIRTTVTPDLVVNVLNQTKAGSPSVALSVLRPSFDLDTGPGGEPLHYAPYGEPSGAITAGVVVGLALLLVLVFYLGMRAK